MIAWPQFHLAVRGFMRKQLPREHTASIIRFTDTEAMLIRFAWSEQPTLDKAEYIAWHILHSRD
jgi:hypothetical protein